MIDRVFLKIAQQMPGSPDTRSFEDELLHNHHALMATHVPDMQPYDKYVKYDANREGLRKIEIEAILRSLATFVKTIGLNVFPDAPAALYEYQIANVMEFMWRAGKINSGYTIGFYDRFSISQHRDGRKRIAYHCGDVVGGFMYSPKEMSGRLLPACANHHLRKVPGFIKFTTPFAGPLDSYIVEFVMQEEHHEEYRPRH